MAQASRPAQIKRRQHRLKPDERRQQLIDATIVCLAKYGARGTGIRQICRELDVAPSLVSYFFAGGRTELLVSAYNDLTARFVEQLEAAARPDGRAASTRMRAVFALYFAPEWLDDSVVGAYVALWSLARTQLDLKEAMSALHQRQRKAIAEPLAALVAEHDARSDVDLLADSLVVFLSGLWLDLGLNPGHISSQRALEMCWGWLDGSLAADR